MNSNKKSTPARGIPQPFNRQAGAVREFKPVVAQLKPPASAHGVKRPVAPPVYRPQVPKVLQTKSSLSPSSQVVRPQPTPRVLQTMTSPANKNTRAQASPHPVAPPVYRPEAKKIVQPKAFSSSPLRSRPVLGATAPGTSAPAKIANSFQPITAKRTASSFFNAVQLAAEKKARKECFATVVAKSDARFEGKYKKIHAEIDALEQYFSSGGKLANISKIELSSAPCKYCHFILKDLGILGKVETDDDRDYGSCSGGSYGWFDGEGNLWAAIQAKTGCVDLDKYITSVIDRKDALK